MKLDFSEIKNWKEFEDLAAAYFRDMPKVIENDVTEVFVEPTGEGGDGGRDILITFRAFDSVVTYERKWVVQCKFYDKAVSKSTLSTVNIPSLIHEYGADGYLLICKNTVRAPVTVMFENLRKNCRFGYNYLIWEGSDFIQQLLSSEQVVEQYFPQYNKFRNS